jgi:hypothetical protein
MPVLLKETKMGAALDYRIYHTTDKDKIRKQWAYDVFCADSSTYGGEIGQLGDGLDFSETEIQASDEDAVEFLNSTHDKGEPALAIPFRLKNDTTGYVCGGLCSE